MACLDNMIQNDGCIHVRGMGLRGVRGSGGPLGLRGVRGPGGAFGGARRLDGHHRRGPLRLRGVRGPGCTLGGARRLHVHPFRGPLGLGGVRGPGCTVRGAGRFGRPPHRGPLGMYAITKSMHGTRNLQDGSKAVESSQDRLKAVASSGEESGTKLLVSNLNAGVSNEDIRGLFSEIGELIRCTIHYDQNGSPCGSAEIVFARSRDAFHAVKRYNSTELDGKPLKIEKVGSISRDHVAPRLNMIGGANGRRTGRVRPGPGYTRDVDVHNNGAGSSTRRGHGGWSGGIPQHGRGRHGCRGGGRGHGGLGGRPVEKSAEELDKELENYQAEASQA